jgi:hypothetical protein
VSIQAYGVKSSLISRNLPFSSFNPFFKACTFYLSFSTLAILTFNLYYDVLPLLPPYPFLKLPALKIFSEFSESNHARLSSFNVKSGDLSYFGVIVLLRVRIRLSLAFFCSIRRITSLRS